MSDLSKTVVPVTARRPAAPQAELSKKKRRQTFEQRNPAGFAWLVPQDEPKK